MPKLSYLKGFLTVGFLLLSHSVAVRAELCPQVFYGAESGGSFGSSLTGGQKVYKGSGARAPSESELEIISFTIGPQTDQRDLEIIDYFVELYRNETPVGSGRWPLRKKLFPILKRILQDLNQLSAKPRTLDHIPFFPTSDDQFHYVILGLPISITVDVAREDIYKPTYDSDRLKAELAIADSLNLLANTQAGFTELESKRVHFTNILTVIFKKRPTEKLANIINKSKYLKKFRDELCGLQPAEEETDLVDTAPTQADRDKQLREMIAHLVDRNVGYLNRRVLSRNQHLMSLIQPFWKKYEADYPLGPWFYLGERHENFLDRKWSFVHVMHMYFYENIWPEGEHRVVDGVSQVISYMKETREKGRSPTSVETRAAIELIERTREPDDVDYKTLPLLRDATSGALISYPHLLSFIGLNRTNNRSERIVEISQPMHLWTRILNGEIYKLAPEPSRSHAGPSSEDGSKENTTKKQTQPEKRVAREDRILDENPSIREMVEQYADTPQLLAEILQDLYPKEFIDLKVSDFVARYVGLHASEIAQRSSQARKKPGQRREVYIRGLLAALESQTANVDMTTLQRPLEHLMRLCRLEFQIYGLATVTKLEEDAELFRFMENISDKSRDFLVRLHRAAAKQFLSILNFEPINIKSKLFEYQKEGAKFLIDHPYAILADEAGLGKTLQVVTAAEFLGLKRIIFATTATNKTNIMDDILEHSHVRPDEIAIIDASNPADRARQIEQLGESVRYIIINYEQLAKLHLNSDKSAFHRLTKGVDLVVADEGHFADNASTQRAEALYAINSPRKWVISATPYQNKIERLYNILNYIDSVAFPSKEFFHKEYLATAGGLLKLHSRLYDYMLRRRKTETIPYFEGSDIQEFDQQLADGGPRIPRKIRIDHTEQGAFELLPEQSKMLAQMSFDYASWAREFNQSRPMSVDEVPLTVNSLQKFNLMHQIMYEPERFGINGENPIYLALDKIVLEKMKRGEKVILWGYNVDVLDTLEARYRQFGVARIDGSKNLQEKNKARDHFQEKGARILVANYRSGGVGLTLTAAHSAIYVQLPLQFGEYYQSEGRHQRVIGMNNLRHAKESVEVLWMVPKYSRILNSAADQQTLLAAYQAGTLGEQTVRRLQGGELVYQLVMDGLLDPDEFEIQLKRQILTGLESKSPDFSQEAQVTSVARLLMPLVRDLRARGDEDRALTAVDLLARDLENGVDIANAIAETKTFTHDDVDLIISIYGIRNSHVRQKILKKLPTVLRSFIASGTSLSEAASGLPIGALTATEFVANLLLQSQPSRVTKLIVAKLRSVNTKNPANRWLINRFNSAIIELKDTWGEDWLSQNENLFAELSLEKSVTLLYRLALAVRFSPTDALDIKSGDVDFLCDLLASLTLRQARSVKKAFKGHEAALEAAVAIGLEFRSETPPMALRQFEESLGSVIDGNYSSWRTGAKVYGNSVIWPEHSEWLETFLADKSELSAPGVPGSHLNSLINVRDAVLSHHFQMGETRLIEMSKIFANASPSDRQVKLHLVESYRATLEQWITNKAKLNPLLKLAMENTFGPTKPDISADDLSDLRWAQDFVHQLNFAYQLENAITEVSAGQDSAIIRLSPLFEKWESFHRNRGHIELADILGRFQGPAQKKSSDALTVSEVSDPMLLLRQGQLTPELVNCFNQDGNPYFTQYVLTTLGSPNIKMLIARNQSNQIVGVAMMKLKYLEDGSPVLFLERGMERSGDPAIRTALERFTWQKAVDLSKSGLKTEAMTDSEIDEGNRVVVRGSGAYTHDEYVESVFGLRAASKVKHLGRKIEFH